MAWHGTGPQRYSRRPSGLALPHALAQVSRFLTDEVRATFDERGPQVVPVDDADGAPVEGVADVDALLSDLFG